MEQLAQKMLPAYALALDLPQDFFSEPFAEATYSFRMSHYPPSELGDADQFGVAAHTDSSFLTMLPQGDRRAFRSNCRAMTGTSSMHRTAQSWSTQAI